MTRHNGPRAQHKPAALIVAVRRMRIHCLVAGTGPEPVVLLHGGGIDFYRQVPDVTERSPAGTPGQGP